MPTSPYIKFTVNGKEFTGSADFNGKEGTSEIFEFSHEVCAIGENYITGEMIREHKNIKFVKAINFISTNYIRF